MGYTTTFDGELKFNRELTHMEWLDLTRLGDCYDHEHYAEFTDTPETLPDGYLQWVPNQLGTGLIWNSGEKFYDYIHWLRWLIKHYMKPRGIVLNGEIRWQGEEIEDTGVIVATNNKITTKKLVVEGIVDCPNCGERFLPKNV